MSDDPFVAARELLATAYGTIDTDAHDAWHRGDAAASSRARETAELVRQGLAVFDAVAELATRAEALDSIARFLIVALNAIDPDAVTDAFEDAVDYATNDDGDPTALETMTRTLADNYLAFFGIAHPEPVSTGLFTEEHG